MKRKLAAGVYFGRHHRRLSLRSGLKAAEEYIQMLMRRVRRKGAEQELFASCILLKNLAIVQKDIPMSCDYILEQLMENSLFLRPVYHEILFRWRGGAGVSAFDALTEAVDGKSAAAFALILSKLEQINPVELVTAMRSFEENFQGERMTRAMHRTYVKSVLTTAAAMAAIFAILMNFVIVVVFMDMFSMLGEIQGF